MPSAVIRCPFPFPDVEATTFVKVYQQIDTEDQGPKETLIYEGMAIYDETTKNTFNSDSKLIALSGKLIVHGEIQMDSLSIQGYVEINEEKKEIYSVSKPKIFGQVYSTEILLR